MRLSALIVAALAGCAPQAGETVSTADAVPAGGQPATQPGAQPTQPGGVATTAAAPDTGGLRVAKLPSGWVVITGFNDEHRYVCAAVLSDRTQTSTFSLGWNDTTSRIAIVLRKTSWKIPPASRIPIRIEVPGVPAWAGTASGHDTFVDSSMNEQEFGKFFVASTMAGAIRIAFPVGNEPVWRVNAVGLPQAALLMQGCIINRRRAMGAAAPETTQPGTTSPGGTPARRRAPHVTRPLVPDTPLTTM